MRRVIGYIGSTTRKVAQLTGERDRERGVDCINATESRVGLFGTDLGVSFEHNGRLWFLFGDTVSAVGYDPVLRPDAGDSIAWTTDTSVDDGLNLTFLVAPDGRYLSPRIDPPVPMGPFNVPVTGFSWGGQMYVVFTTDAHVEPPPVRMGRSMMTRLTDEKGLRFRTLYELSPRGGRFLNVSTGIVDCAKVAGLPQAAGAGLLLWGSGAYRDSQPYLAFLPLNQVESKAAMRYYTGASGSRRWSDREGDAALLFVHPQFGELSVAWIPQVEGWLMLYNTGQPRGIVYRFAAQPWGPWTDARVLFDPWCDGGYGHFMHASWRDHGRADTVHDLDRENEWGGEYGPYLIPKFTRRDRSQVTVYYVLSTWNPYNTHLMRSTFRLDPWRGWYMLAGAQFRQSAPLAAVTRDPDRMEIWSTGADGVVRGNWFDGSWRGWYALGGADISPDAGLAAVSRHPTRMEVWAVGLDGRIRGRSYDGTWRDWYRLDGATFAPACRPTAVTRHPDRMEVWAVDSNGLVRGNWFDGSWRGWYALAGARFDPAASLAAVSRDPDRMEVWGIDTRGIVRGNWFDGSGWHGWYELGGATFDPKGRIAAVSRHPSRMEVWAVDTNGQLRGNWYDNGWHGWYTLDGPPDTPVRFRPDAPVVAVERGEMQIDVWALAEDSRVWTRSLTRTWGAWRPLDDAGFNQGTSLAAVSRHPDRMELWAMGMDGIVRGTWFDDS